MSRWSERIASVERSRNEAEAANARAIEVLHVQWEEKMRATRAEVEAQAASARVEWEAELAISRS